MKHLFLIALSFLLLNLVTNAKSKNSDQAFMMKIEESCSGHIENEPFDAN